MSCFLHSAFNIKCVDGKVVSSLRDEVLWTCIGIIAVVWPGDPPEASLDPKNKNFLTAVSLHLFLTPHLDGK